MSGRVTFPRLTGRLLIAIEGRERARPDDTLTARADAESSDGTILHGHGHRQCRDDDSHV